MAGIWSVQRIKDTASRASRGDIKAIKALQKYNYQQAVNANKRLARFEKAGEHSPAYDLAKAYLKRSGTGERFTRSKKISIKQLETQLLELRKFNTAKTGSISGLRKYKKEQLAQLERQLGIEIPSHLIPKIEDFLQSDLFTEYKQFDSERALEEGIASIIENDGLNLDRLEEVWEEYLERETDLIEAFDRFVEIDVSENPFD